MSHLDPKIIIVLFVKNFLGTAYVIPLWFLGVFLLERFWKTDIPLDTLILLLDGAGIIFLAFLIVGCYCWAWLTFNAFTYEFAADGFHINKGVLFRRQIVMPYTDIDDALLLVNPLIVRTLQLYSVQVTTHEAINTEGIVKKKQLLIIPGLTSDAARSLRVELLKDSHMQPVRKTFFDPTSGRYHS